MQTSGGLAHGAQRFRFHAVLARQAQQTGSQREARIHGLAAGNVAHRSLPAVQTQRDFWLSDASSFQPTQNGGPVNKGVHAARISNKRSECKRESYIALPYPKEVSTDFGKRLKAARDFAGLTQEELAQKAGMAQSTLATAEMKGAGSRKTPQLAAVCGVDAHWLATGMGEMLANPGQPRVGLSLQAHPVILDKFTVVPTISWEALLNSESLPEVFELPAPDASMAPKVPQGTLVKFERNLVPRPGDGVLVRDREGHHYVRVYREKRPGHWEAYAINDAYSPLDSQADGLTVVAVLTAVAGRWA